LSPFEKLYLTPIVPLSMHGEEEPVINQVPSPHVERGLKGEVFKWPLGVW